MDEIRVLVVEYHPLFRKGVVSTLSCYDDIKITGETDNGETALQLIREISPNVAIVDNNIPRMNGLQLTRKISKPNSSTRVILLSAVDNQSMVIHAIRSGASAYRTKNVGPEELVTIVKAVAAGMYVIGDNVMDGDGLDEWLQSYTKDILHNDNTPNRQYRPLSVREMEVLSNLTLGNSNKEIAAILRISHQTVKNHVSAILRKLKVNDRTQAVLYALKNGWFQLQD